MKQRAMFVSLALALLLSAALPAAASASPLASFEGIGAWELPQWLTGAWGAFQSLWEKEGLSIDPHGQTAPNDAGASVDPNGGTAAYPMAPSDEGHLLDPNGAPLAGAGLSIDPDGQTAGPVATSEAGHLLDPNG